MIHRRDRLRRAALGLGLVLAAVTVAPTVASAAGPTTIDRTVGQAYAYAGAHSVRASVSVLDLRTGRYWGAGNGDAYYGAASVMKLFVATKLLALGQMHGATATLAWSMITRSDSRALVRLLPKVGGTGVINWVKARYGLPRLGFPPLASRDWCWGNTHISARGLVQFYARMRADRKVAPWLTNALHHYTTYDTDGVNQTFGLPSATRGAAVKQGEGHCSSDSNGSVVNTTGLAGGDRYAVAILTDSHICCDAGGFNGSLAGIVTRMARTVLPHGYVDLPETHNPIGRVEAVSARGSTVTVSGWALDPDTRNSPMTVRVAEGSTTRWQGATSVYRRDVDTVQHALGRHGFVARFAATDGPHVFCIYRLNTGMGNASPRQCYPVTVDGRPRGHLDQVFSTDGGVDVTGWAYDPDAVPAPSSVQITLDDAVVATVVADRARAAGTYPVGGDHGFATTVPASPGPHTVCVTALDPGPASAPTDLGCRAVTVPAAPTSSPLPRSILPQPSASASIVDVVGGRS